MSIRHIYYEDVYSQYDKSLDEVKAGGTVEAVREGVPCVRMIPPDAQDLALSATELTK